MSKHWFLPLAVQWGVAKIHVISVVASSSGLKQLVLDHPDIDITTGTVDTKTSEDGVLLPGIGDSGDRQFATHTPVDQDDSESLLHPSKRKRSPTHSS